MEAFEREQDPAHHLPIHEYSPQNRRRPTGEVVCLSVHLNLFQAQRWRRHSRKSPKVSKWVLDYRAWTLQGICKGFGEEGQVLETRHTWGLEDLSVEGMYWVIAEKI